MYEAIRYVSSNDQPVLRFDEPRIAGAGDCACLADTLDTSALAAGRYTYHVRWRPGPDDEPRQAETSFEIAAPAEPVSTPGAIDEERRI